MNVKQFSDWARTGGEALRADVLVIQTAEGEFEAHGTMRVYDEKFLLKVTLHGERELPRVPSPIARKDFWKISGLLEDELRFCALGISHNRQFHSGRVTVLQATFDLDRLSFVTEESTEAEKSLHAQVELLRNTTSQINSDEPPGDTSAQLHCGYARLVGHKLLWKNGQTKTDIANDFMGKRGGWTADTFMGKIGMFEYALIKVEGDVEFHLRTTDGSPPITDGEFQKTFDGFLTSIAFLHGREAWPQHCRIERGFMTLEEVISPRCDLPSTPLVVLNETACANGADFGKAMRAALAFFLSPEIGALSLPQSPIKPASDANRRRNPQPLLGV
jgi:hypothetical protein